MYKRKQYMDVFPIYTIHCLVREIAALLLIFLSVCLFVCLCVCLPARRCDCPEQRRCGGEIGQLAARLVLVCLSSFALLSTPYSSPCSNHSCDDSQIATLIANRRRNAITFCGNNCVHNNDKTEWEKSIQVLLIAKKYLSRTFGSSTDPRAGKDSHRCRGGFSKRISFQMGRCHLWMHLFKQKNFSLKVNVNPLVLRDAFRKNGKNYQTGEWGDNLMRFVKTFLIPGLFGHSYSYSINI